MMRQLSFLVTEIMGLVCGPNTSANIPDLYVAREYRSRAVAIRLLAAVARAAGEQGATYVRADRRCVAGRSRTAQTRAAVYCRLVGESIYVSGRAFRELPQLIDVDLKTLVRRLPTPEASREP
jgi:GNAT superfamily N-acetyltransferase